MRRETVDLILMGKKKKIHVNKDENNSTDEDEKETDVCTHMKQSVNLSHMRRGLKEYTQHGKCQKCVVDKNEESQQPSVYVCLQCGHQGCDRSSSEQHALKHFQSFKSHSCAVNTDDFQVWCYKCNDFRHLNFKTCKDCVEFVSKLFSSKGQKNGVVNVDSKPVQTGEDINLPTSVSAANPTKFSKVKGLSNLGNTCFFNAVVQNINQSYLFEQLLREKEGKGSEVKLKVSVKEDDEEDPDSDNNLQSEACILKENSLTIQLEACKDMTKSLLKLYEDMKEQNNRSGIVSPGNLFGHVCKKSPQFRGFQQQDSHELLRHLLDGVREEEIKRLKTGILNAYNINKDSKNSLTDYKKEQVKSFGHSTRHTTADEVFGGSFISTVTCEECQTPHQIYESFLDVSLPILEDKSKEDYSKVEKFKVMQENGCGYKKKNLDDEKPSKYMNKKERKASKKLKKQNKRNKTSKQMILINGNQEDEKGNKEDDAGDDDDDEEADGHTEKELIDKTDTLEINESDETRLDNEVADCGSLSTEVTDSKDFSVENSNDVLNNGTAGNAVENGLEREFGGDFEINATDDRDDLSLFDNDDNVVPLINNHTNSSVPEKVDDCLSSSTNYKSFVNISKSVSKLKLEAMKIAMTSLSERGKYQSQECSVVSCLYQFTSREMLFGNNRYLCDHCNSSKDKNLKYTVASKQVLIYAPPAILTLHLKRFQQTLTSFKKVNKHVAFDEILDIAPFCSTLARSVKAGQKRILYALYGVVEHSGTLRGGHYTAYVKVRDEIKDARKYIKSILCENYSPDTLVQSLHERHSKDANHEQVQGHNGHRDDEIIAPPPGRWFYVSDSHVSEVKDISNVLRCEAYLLFYERIL